MAAGDLWDPRTNVALGLYAASLPGTELRHYLGYVPDVAAEHEIQLQNAFNVLNGAPRVKSPQLQANEPSAWSETFELVGHGAGDAVSSALKGAFSGLGPGVVLAGAAVAAALLLKD